MKTQLMKYAALIVITVFMLASIGEIEAWARAGGGKSFGSRGSRSMSAPTRPDAGQTTRPSMQQQQQRSQSMATPPVATPQRPSFARSLFTAVAGGFLGAMLFGGIAHAMGGLGGFGGSGIGLIEILVIGGLLYFLFRVFRKKKEQENYAYERSTSQPYQQSPHPTYDTSFDREPASLYQPSDVEKGLQYIRQMDSSFNEAEFKEIVTDLFFKVQSAWGNRDLSIAAGVLTDEMRQALQKDIDELKNKRQINRIENIAVRNVEITEAWQENGQDFITVLFTANVLDYTVDETTGSVVAGSKTDPVRFEEYWTFTRPVGNNQWKLSAINQA